MPREDCGKPWVHPIGKPLTPYEQGMLHNSEVQIRWLRRIAEAVEAIEKKPMATSADIRQLAILERVEIIRLEDLISAQRRSFRELHRIRRVLEQAGEPGAAVGFTMQFSSPLSEE